MIGLLGAVVVALITGAFTVAVARITVRDNRKRIGDPNGRGDLVSMILHTHEKIDEVRDEAKAANAVAVEASAAHNASDTERFDTVTRRQDATDERIDTIQTDFAALAKTVDDGFKSFEEILDGTLNTLLTERATANGGPPPPPRRARAPKRAAS